MTPRATSPFVPLCLAGTLCLGACSTPAPAGELTLDIRNVASLAYETRAHSIAKMPGARLTLNVKRGDKELNRGAFDIFDSTKALVFDVTEESFDEASLSLYVGTQTVKPFSGSRCGQEPITLALSLARRDGNARVAGSLSAYCGALAAGTPARIVRIAGSLPVRALP